MNAISFTVYGTAAPAGSKKGFVNRKTGRVIITDDSKRSKPWQALVRDAAVDAMTTTIAGAQYVVHPLDGPVLLDLTFWVARPKGHYGSGRNSGAVRTSAPHAPTVKPDLLKLARAVEDALTGVIYRDDAQITCETLQKAYTTGQPYTQIRVTPIVHLGEHRPLPEEPALTERNA